MIGEQIAPLLDVRAWHGNLFSTGWQIAAGGTVDVTDKSTDAVLATVGLANAEDVSAACRCAYEAAPAWAATEPSQRAAILERAADALLAARDELIPWIMRETGSIAAKAQREVDVASHELREAAGLCGHLSRHVVEAGPEVESVAVRVPLGVVGVITPWNFPLILAMRSIAPALALGNTVVLKPDIQTPVAGGFLIAAALTRAGLPGGVFHVLPGDAEPGAALTSDPHVAMISFTGSTAVGRVVGANAGWALKRVALELGGNSPLIVLEDADLELASSGGAFGSFFHQGQICMAASRHLVHESVVEAYVARLAERANRLAVGDPTTQPVALGPLINDEQLARVRDIVERSVAAGAGVVAGGTAQGRFYRPTVLTGVTPEMPAFTDEIFGPVAPVTTFRTDEEAIALANRSEYGLSSAIYSGDVARALALAGRLRTGMAHINDQTVNDDARVPFGGVGSSGNGGRFGSLANLEEFTTWRWMTVRERGHVYPF